MNKRIRRKHHLGEFQILGFEVLFETPMTWGDREVMALLDAMIDWVEAHGLGIGGSMGPGRCAHFVCPLAARRSTTPAEREAFAQWISTQPGLSHIVVGPLMDAWYLSDRPRITRRRRQARTTRRAGR